MRWWWWWWCGGGLFGAGSASLLYRREYCIAGVCGDWIVFVVYGLRWAVLASVGLQERWEVVLTSMFDCSADMRC